jgi:hypothetical protein
MECTYDLHVTTILISFVEKLHMPLHNIEDKSGKRFAAGAIDYAGVLA